MVRHTRPNSSLCQEPTSILPALVTALIYSWGCAGPIIQLALQIVSNTRTWREYIQAIVLSNCIMEGNSLSERKLLSD